MPCVNTKIAGEDATLRQQTEIILDVVNQRPTCARNTMSARTLHCG